jgi:hypothetical protein
VPLNVCHVNISWKYYSSEDKIEEQYQTYFNKNSRDTEHSDAMNLTLRCIQTEKAIGSQRFSGLLQLFQVRQKIAGVETT